MQVFYFLSTKTGEFWLNELSCVLILITKEDFDWAGAGKG